MPAKQDMCPEGVYFKSSVPPPLGLHVDAQNVRGAKAATTNDAGPFQESDQDSSDEEVEPPQRQKDAMAASAKVLCGDSRS